MHYVYWKSDNSKTYNIALIISVCILISADEGLLDRRNFIENIKRILQESIYLHKKNIRNMKKILHFKEASNKRKKLRRC